MKRPLRYCILFSCVQKQDRVNEKQYEHGLGTSTIDTHYTLVMKYIELPKRQVQTEIYQIFVKKKQPLCNEQTKTECILHIITQKTSMLVLLISVNNNVPDNTKIDWNTLRTYN